MLEFTVAPSCCNNSCRNQADCITASVFFTSEKKGQFKCHRKGGFISLRELEDLCPFAISAVVIPPARQRGKLQKSGEKILKQNLSVSPGFGSAQACSNKLALSLTRLLEEALAPILDYCCERQVWKEVCQTDGERKTPPKETHPEGQHLNSLLILLAHPPDIHLRALRYQIFIFKSYQHFVFFFPFNF